MGNCQLSVRKQLTSTCGNIKALYFDVHCIFKLSKLCIRLSLLRDCELIAEFNTRTDALSIWKLKIDE